MKFLLQIKNGEIADVEVFNACNLIRNSKRLHEYLLIDLAELKETDKNFVDWIPIGDLLFVKEWLKKYKNISEMKPIEVPECLRKERYLGRTYEIVSIDELKLNGYWFIKDADRLKHFSFNGCLNCFDKERDKELFNSQNYVISEIVDIVSEYRVFVSDLKIKAIQNYDGDCTIFPDVKLLREMVGIYYLEQNRPESYTMDIAVLRNGRTIILEVHPVTSVGTYGYDDKELLNMYKNGIEYYCKTTK